MKKFNLILASALITTLVSANGLENPKPTGSSVAVSNLSGSTLFRLHYQSEKVQNVKVSVLDESGHVIFTEMIKKLDKFVRPYNFENLAEGHYIIQVEDESGKILEKVNFNRASVANSVKVEKWVRVSKLTGEQNKYSLTITSAKEDKVLINIYDNENNLIHSETKQIRGSFAQVYNLKGVESFNIEVCDSNGLVKSVKP